MKALAITMLVLVILGACAFTEVGVFAEFDYALHIGIACIGITSLLFLTGIYRSWKQCLEPPLDPKK